MRQARAVILTLILAAGVFLATSTMPRTTDAAEVNAAPIHFYAVATGDQETPPTGSAGYAIAMFSINSNRSELSFIVMEFGVANITASHLHRAPRGEPGPVVYSIGAFDGTISGTIPFTKSDLADFKAGNFYYNIHTTAFTGGEVRGQLKRAKP